jgi:hypothetical protein
LLAVETEDLLDYDEPPGGTFPLVNRTELRCIWLVSEAAAKAEELFKQQWKRADLPNVTEM